MPDILYTPNRERVITSNAWAFLHWLRTTRGIDLADWAGLQRFSVDRDGEFRAAISGFARLPEAPVLLARHGGPREALVLRKAGGERVALDRDGLRAGGLPAEIAGSLSRLWPPASLVRPLAELLLHADLRPDDRLLVIGAAWPWLAALLEGTAVVLASATPATILAHAAEERATVLVGPAQALAEAAFQRAQRRPNLAPLRTVIATGGPLSPEGRLRIYTWIKSDLLLLARTGDTFWGNPLEAVYTRPIATPGFFTPPPATPATR